MNFEVLWSGSSPDARIPVPDNLTGPIVRSSNPAMLQLEGIVREVAPTDIPVLILGESGSGKEILARQVFCRSSRADKPFLKVHCGRLSQTQADGDSFSFGNEAERNCMGTLLLDGIDELALPLQRNLLELLETEHPVAWVSANQGAAPWRVIATSSRELNEDVRKTRFRADLYYRLSGVCLRLPPLRERKEDIEPLAMFFLERFSEALERRRKMTLSRSGLKVLLNYPWPGNIRELENVIRRLVVLDDEEQALKSLSDAIPSSTPQEGGTRAEEKERLSLKRATRLAVRDVEKELIAKALTKTHWNRKQAAQELGISYKALLYKLRQLGLDA